MCSNLDADIEDEQKYMEEVPQITNLSNCLKCGTENTSIVLRHKDSYCVPCFNAAIDHKFRACLGKSKLIRRNDSVLIIHNGTSSTSTMLKIIDNSQHGEKHKMFNFTCKILYIDNETDIENSKKLAKDCLEEVQNYNFDSYITSISNAAYAQKDTLLDDLANYSEYLKKIDGTPMKCLLANVATLSAKQDLMNTITRKLILSIAKTLKCKFVFYPDTSSELASKTLAGFALGRGNHISMEVGFIDNRDSDVTILRPMRDFSYEEISKFCELHSLRSQKIGDEFDIYASIQNLSDNFIHELQQNFPATVYTVLRTGDKLVTLKGLDGVREQCWFCLSPMDNVRQLDKLTALNAVEFSRTASQMSGEMVASQCLERLELGDGEQKGMGLCHSCCKTLSDVKIKNFTI